ncbi:MAG: hypothetical protein LBR73_06360 [Oscillospiraceae bacterium]|jgi:Holliday junction resolvasome RuvABC DNA-binding subunit|nr:hypothetical protein [Oscillospiraceae bacterium]
MNEAVEALIALGYSPSEAASAVARCGEGVTTQEAIRKSLVLLSG